MEPVDAIQHLAERLPRHSRLSELEHQPPDVAHQPCPDLDELDLRPPQAGRRDPGTGRFTSAEERGRRWPPDAAGCALKQGARLPSAWVALNPGCSQTSELNLFEGLQNGGFWSGGDGGGSIYTVNTASGCSWPREGCIEPFGYP